LSYSSVFPEHIELTA